MQDFSSLKKLFPSNISTSFIADRFECDNYRGMPLSNHNRQMNFEFIWLVLNTIYKYAQNNAFRIRTVDIKKHPSNELWPLYEKIVNDIFSEADRGKGGDSLRKQIFVDLSRIGFVKRLNSKREYEKLSIGFEQKKFRTYFIELPNEICKFLIENNKKDLKRIYLDRLNILTNDLLSILININNSSSTNPIFSKLSRYETAFFLTAYNSKFNGKIVTLDEINNLIKSWRLLNGTQQSTFITALKKRCSEINRFEKAKSSHSKVDLRDYRNFLNHTDQLMFILSQTAFFSYIDSKKSGVIWMNIVETEKDVKGKRSEYEKAQYYSYHNIVQSLYAAYELHHIIPLHTAIDALDRKMLDNHLNMILIDGNSHNYIHHTRDKNNNKLSLYRVEITDNSKSFKLYDPTFVDDLKENAPYIEIINHKNAIFDPNKLKEIKEYNDTLFGE